MAIKIYTKTGDDGRTGLYGGGRVPKDDARVSAYGDVDELNAIIGMARSTDMMPRIDEVLAPVQRDLFAIGALLATPNREKHKEQLEKARISDKRIAQLEQGAHDSAFRGSSASRSASPMKVNSNKVNTSKAKVDIEIHQASILVLPWANISPRLGVPGGTPKPKKSRLVKARMAALMRNGKNVTTGVRLLGST